MSPIRLSALLLAVCVSSQAVPAGASPGDADASRAAHDAMLVLDTHFDTPMNLGRPGWSMRDRHDSQLDGDQVDLPRMIDGGVDGGFFAIFTPQRGRTAEAVSAARDFAIGRAVQIREMVASLPEDFALATSAEDARRITGQGKRFVFLSMENGQPVAGDPGLLGVFHSLGVTMAGPVHGLNNDLADSATDPAGPEWHGLSPKGQAFVVEANRLGILIDASHASDEALRQMVALSRAPIILSHSGMRAIFPHPRNVSDADAKLVAAKGGVIQINAFNDYMIETPRIPEREAALKSLMARFVALGPAASSADRKAIFAERREIDIRWPVRRAAISDLVAHIRHAVDLVGIDHVGVSGDFDGGGGIDGFQDVTDFPRLTGALFDAGFSREDIAKIWGGNALRVLSEAQALAGASPTSATGVK